jgi:predicted nucleotidyltransferase component of viral defense system
MIKPGEINQFANVLGVRDTQIEKDYVIGWVLKGISNSGFLKEHLIFKGGTALRKIYFHDYRLSEDIDFTYLGNDCKTEASLDV